MQPSSVHKRVLIILLVIQVYVIKYEYAPLMYILYLITSNTYMYYCTAKKLYAILSNEVSFYPMAQVTDQINYP